VVKWLDKGFALSARALPGCALFVCGVGFRAFPFLFGYWHYVAGCSGFFAYLHLRGHISWDFFRETPLDKYWILPDASAKRLRVLMQGILKLGENVGVRGIVFHCEQLCANFTNFILAPAHSRDALLR
jgi:hypothetical protein